MSEHTKHQNDLFQQQEATLEELLCSVKRQKAIAEQIHTEILSQNHDIDHLDNHIEKSSDKVHCAQKRLDCVAPPKNRWCSIM
ncbi:MAG: hypothetical protein EBU90_09160 [Proteobacteria bacterium]|nr:hypothetical protein [Pseudomonadota bacterium]NBP14278.1 hypothetical protein [bacterium]